MPRKLRIEFAGAVYPAMSRGNRGEVIVGNDRDRVRVPNTLGEAREKTGWQIHAWVLRFNHDHLLLETPQPNLVTGGGAGVHWADIAMAQSLGSGTREILSLNWRTDPYLPDSNIQVEYFPELGRCVV